MHQLITIGPLVAVILLVSACATHRASTLDRLQQTRTLAIGYRQTSPPFSFVDTARKPAGYSIDLCNWIVADLRETLKLSDLAVRWVAVTPEDRIQAVVDGRIDLECGTTTNTLSRQEQVDFTHLTFVDGGSLLVRRDAGIRELADLVGKRIGVIPGTTTEKALTEWIPKNVRGPELVPFREHSDGLVALDGGRIDAYASERTVLIGLALNSRNPRGLAILDDYYSYEPYAFMVRRGDAAFRLAVNRALSKAYRLGEVLRIYERWFGALGRPSRLLIDLYLLNALPE